MSQAAPDSANEDFVIASDSWCVVLDGATELAGVDSGCCHGVSWYVSRLGLSLADLLTTDPVGSLPDILGQSISHVSELHEATCDLSNPDSPSSVVLILRERQNHIDYLALSDSVIVLDDRDDGLRIILDDRTAHLPSHTIEAVRALRNSDDGFWVASTLPEASKHALTGSVLKSSIRSAILLTDGASRLVDKFGWSWQEVVELIERVGPSGVIHEVRTAESEAKAVRGKLHDDATVASGLRRVPELPRFV
jgi:Protein phosphatase 2C